MVNSIIAKLDDGKNVFFLDIGDKFIQPDVSLTKKKFGQFVPIAGIAFGAISNFALVDKIAAAANDAYRERFVVEKSGGELSRVGNVTVEHVAVEDGISLIEILEDEDALPVPELGVATPTDGES